MLGGGVIGAAGDAADRVEQQGGSLPPVQPATGWRVTTRATPLSWALSDSGHLRDRQGADPVLGHDRYPVIKGLVDRVLPPARTALGDNLGCWARACSQMLSLSKSLERACRLVADMSRVRVCQVR